MSKFKCLELIGLIGIIGLVSPLAAPAQVGLGPYVYNGGVPVTPPVTAYAAVAAMATNLTPRLGFVASGTRMDMNASANHEWMQRTFLVASVPIGGVQIAFQNWYDPGTGIVGPGGSQYLTATIEYPSNTFTRVTFGGFTNAVIANGSYVMSDYVPLAVPIPEGAMFWVRSWASNGVGGVCYDGPPYANSTYNYAQSAATVTDVTGGPGVGSMGTSQYWNPPLAVIGWTAKPSILMFGDSRLGGQGDMAIDGGGDLSTSSGQSRIPDARGYGEANMGIASETWQNWTVNDQELLYFTNFATAVYMEMGINDMFVGGEPANYVETNLTMLATNLPVPLYTCTEEPRTTSIDNFTTLWGQVVNGADDSQRVAFNQALRNHLVSGVRGYLDLAQCVESSTNSGTWAVNGQPGWLTADGVHASTVGLKLEVASVIDFFNGKILVPIENGFVGSGVLINGQAGFYNGSIVMHSNTFTVFNLTNNLNNGDVRLLYSNGPAASGAWVSCLWSNGVPVTNYAATTSGGVLR